MLFDSNDFLFLTLFLQLSTRNCVDVVLSMRVFRIILMLPKLWIAYSKMLFFKKVRKIVEGV